MDSTTATLDVLAPLSGLRIPLSRVPDAVFAQRLVGDGASIDPTSATLCAPIAGVVVQLHGSLHALSLRSDEGIELLLHVGIDTVQLRGEGFTAHVRQGDRVQLGQRLLSFDLDAVARRARSLLTQVVVANMDRVAAIEHGRGELRGGDSLLFRVRLRAASSAEAAAPAGDETLRSAPLRLPNPAGLHARPAALIAETARRFDAEVRLRLDQRVANAKSVVALLALETRQGDLLQVEASGPEAAAARDALVALLHSGSGDDLSAPASTAPAAAAAAAETHAEGDPDLLRGVPASPGLAVGQVAHWRRARIEVSEFGDSPARERERLEAALQAARHELAALQGSLSDATRGSILAAHEALLEDPELLEQARAGVDHGRSAGFAWRQAFEHHAAALAALSNPLLRERAADLRDVGERVLAQLAGVSMAPIELPPDCILLAEELSPSDTAQLDRSRVRGFCTSGGGATGHVAILARALGIPALCGIDARALALSAGTAVILDGDRGTLRVRPDAAALTRVAAQMAADGARHAAEAAAAQQPARSRDGVRIEVVANVRHAEDTREALAAGAEGVGLLRSEFLFDDRDSAPSEDEQAAAYRAVAELLGPERPLVIRTLDVGGDKPLPYLPLPREDNPFLGLRGIRVSLAHPALFRSQLRALLRATGLAKLQVMLPMVATLDELRAARAILVEESVALGVAPPPLGIMIEVPSAALQAEAFAREADFFSIGSNDLTQYTLAMDRGHPRLAAQADALHPAVLQLIRLSCTAAARHGRWAGLCGALASDPLAAPLLVGLGVNELSVSTPAIAAVKAAIARFSLAECRQLAEYALAQDGAAAVRQHLIHVAGARADAASR